MLRSRCSSPYQNQSAAETRYALHEITETPAASWRSQIVSTWGIVMSIVATDMKPSTRRNALGGGDRSILGCRLCGSIATSVREDSSAQPCRWYAVSATKEVRREI